MLACKKGSDYPVGRRPRLFPSTERVHACAVPACMHVLCLHACMHACMHAVESHAM